MTPRAGRIIGNYELGELIGRGGASEVYAGEHRFLRHPVAVKLLRGELGADDPPLDAFLGEAARARAVQHPGVVAVLDFGRDEESGRCYLVMERIPGESLAARLARAGRLDEEKVRQLGAALADGMQAAHDGGIVHRDLKPANVMLSGEQPTIVDFGLARDLGGHSALETGRRVGTPAYMAPEQLTGGLIAPCVDIWALGVILFEALSGRLPFEGFADGRCPQLFEVAPRVAAHAAVSPALDALIAGCLQREPGRRPASMAEIAMALRGESAERITQEVGGPGAAEMLTTPETPGTRRVEDVEDVADAAAGQAGQAGQARRAGRRRWMFVGGAAALTAAAIAAVAIAATAAGGGAAGEGAASSESPRTGAVAMPAGARTPATSTAPSTAASVPSAPSAPSARSTSPSSPATAAPANLDVEVHSTPSGAEVIVHGVRHGRTPARVALTAPGSILVRKPGYRPARIRVERSGLVDVRLTRRPHTRPERERRGETLD